MPAVPIDTVLDQLRWRYATKQFDPARKVPPELWARLEEAAVLAPSSYGLQPWRFVVVTDPAVRAELKSVAWNQPQITDASHLVVFCARTGMGPADGDRLVAQTAAARGVPEATLEGFRGMLHKAVAGPPETTDAWAARQVYIALGVLLSACAMAGVDACPMEGFQSAEFDRILGLPNDGYKSVALAAVGYRAADDKYAAAPKVRYPVDEVVQRV